MATESEIRTAARLAGDALRGMVRSIAHVHMAVADRAFDAVGPAGAPVRVTHDQISRGVYWAVGGAHALVPRAGVAVATAVPRSASSANESEQSWLASSSAVRLLAALNGMRGDLIAEQYPDLAVPMTLRHGGGDVDLDGEGLASAFPTASSRLVIFVHGLCESDESWWRGAERDHADPPTSYGSLLHDDLGFTPVYVRYNSGLRVADNGRSLGDLVEQVVAEWPVPVEEIAFVGHSMGGLVVRSACHRGEVDGHRWPKLVSHVFCLGTPHFGAPLERGVNTAARLLARLPETQPLATFLDNRSVGVKDLGQGLFADADWTGNDPDEFLDERRSEVPFLPHATYYFVGATVTRDRHHPLGRAIGDLLVQYPSASGSTDHRTLPFELDNGFHVGGLNHFDLLNHSSVYEQLKRWLT